MSLRTHYTISYRVITLEHFNNIKSYYNKMRNKKEIYFNEIVEFKLAAAFINQYLNGVLY